MDVNTTRIGLEDKLRLAPNKLRQSMNTKEYKHKVMGDNILEVCFRFLFVEVSGACDGRRGL